MDEITPYLRTLKEWRDSDNKSITNVLTKINQLDPKYFEEVSTVLHVVTNFHKEITKESNADGDWFKLCLLLKKKLKKIEELLEKSKIHSETHLPKRISKTIEYPAALLDGRGDNDQQILKYLYKSFVTNFEQAEGQTNTVKFIMALVCKLKDQFEYSVDGIKKKVNSICMHMAREGSKSSKKKMLEGAITLKQVFEDNEQLYFDDEARKRIDTLQKEQLEASSTGYYDDMKKNINKDANEECRYCHALRAYCQDQKQIRASDEPMTRFMRCNNCNKGWRD